MKLVKISLISVFVFLYSCSQDKQVEKPIIQYAAKPEQIVNATGDTTDILLLTSDNMKYNKELLEVSEGQMIRLILKHTGTTPKASMGHNFVLLNNNVSIDDFGQYSAQAKDSDYIPPEFSREIIVHTKMIGGGEADTILFLTPVKGEYNYVCSFPGHYLSMKGKLIIN